MKTYTVTFNITTDTDPNYWEWDNFLNLDENEDYSIVSITKQGETSADLPSLS
jgi:hypothetical protein